MTASHLARSAALVSGLTPAALMLAGAAAAPPAPPAAEWFQQQEQRLMDAVATGDKAVWAALLAEDYVLTSFTVTEKDGVLYGARNTAAPRRLIPLTPEAFVLEGTLGEWLFVREGGRATRIVNLRKFEPLRVDAAR